MPNQSSILLIEDSSGECELFRQALAKARLDVALFVEHDTEAALHFLTNRQGLPSLILLDWHLRHQHGDIFLKQLRSQARFAAIPIVIFTISDEPSDPNPAYANGPNGYVVKPGAFDELVDCVRVLCRYWIDLNRTPYLVGATC